MVAPPLPAGYPHWERWGAHAAHGVLYLLIFLLPLSGWAHDSAWKGAATHPMYLFGVVPWPRIGLLTAIPYTAAIVAMILIQFLTGLIADAIGGVK